MSYVRRWWDKHGGQAFLAVLVLTVAYFVRASGAAPVSELYYFLIRPFQIEAKISPEEQLTNARILELEEKLVELEHKNKELYQFIGYAKTEKKDTILAQIIGRNPDNWWQQAILDKGSQDGIKPGFVVTGIGGLVGRITQVTRHTSRVLLIGDSTSKIGITIGRSRVPGYIQGQGSQIATMRFFEKVPNVRPGDTISTSSSSRLFPSGLPVGRVKSVSLGGKNLPEAKVELTAAIGNLEFVTIHPFTNK